MSNGNGTSRNKGTRSAGASAPASFTPRPPPPPAHAASGGPRRELGMRLEVGVKQTLQLVMPPARSRPFSAEQERRLRQLQGRKRNR